MKSNPNSREEAYAQFLAYSKNINARAKRVQQNIHERGWAIAHAHGINRDLCCLHNASIDDDMRGWCKDAPERLKAAKRAVAILDDWSAHRLAEILTARMWNRLLGNAHGYAEYSQSDFAKRPTINRHLLFSAKGGAR